MQLITRIACAVSLSLAVSGVSAAPIIQNSGVFDASISAFDPIGQSFIAQDPFLSTLGLAFSDINPGFPNEPITMALYEGSGFSGSLVGSVTQTLPVTLPGTLDPPQFINFDFSGTALSVGQTYTVGVTVPSSPKVAVVYSGTDVYAGGQAYAAGALSSCAPGCDLNFQVVPASVMLPGSTVAPTPSANVPPGFISLQTWLFEQATPRNWFDPPLADGFLYELSGGGEFLEVAGVPGFSDLGIVVNGVVVNTDLDAGESFFFSPGVTAFSLVGITPQVDAGDPTAFPTFLDFTSGGELRMTALATNSSPPTSLPEPGAFGLLGLIVAAIGATSRRSKKAA